MDSHLALDSSCVDRKCDYELLLRLEKPHGYYDAAYLDEDDDDDVDYDDWTSSGNVSSFDDDRLV